MAIGAHAGSPHMARSAERRPRVARQGLVLSLVSTTAFWLPCTGGYCGCDDFCEGKCRFAGPGHRENLTVYRVTPYNVSGLDNKNTGDAAGDLFFRLGDELWLRSFCRAHPELHYDRCKGGNWADAGLLRNDVYASFTVETDGSYGPYSQCNPVGKNARRFQCEPNYCGCPRAQSAVGFYNLSDVTWGPPALPHPYDNW